MGNLWSDENNEDTQWGGKTTNIKRNGLRWGGCGKTIYGSVKETHESGLKILQITKQNDWQSTENLV